MRANKRLVLFCTSIGLSLGAGAASAAVSGVWAVGDGEKVYRYEAEHPGRHGNLTWDGKEIHLRGLFNEVLAFQVIVEADSLGAPAVEVSVDPPVGKTGAQVIGGPGAVAYGAQGYVEVFSQHYIRVQRPTKPLWFYGTDRCAAAAPKRMTGWIPDPLIPPDATAGRGGFPLDIPPTAEEVVRSQETLTINARQALQNQGFWFDLYLPRAGACPAGEYTGAVRVLSAGKTVWTCPLRLTLLPLSLPDENHSNTWLFSSASALVDYLGLPPAQAERMLKFESHRHRIDCTGGFEANSRPFDEAMLARYKPWLDGSGYTSAAGYEGPGQGSGEKLFPVGMYGGLTGSAFGTREKARAESDRWVNWFEKNAPGVKYFWYVIDEPGPVQFPWMHERAGWIHDNPGPGKRLPVFTTREYTPELDRDIDYWAGYHGVNLEMLPKLKARGGEHWFYNGARPRYGAEILEAEAVDFRVNAWMKYLYGVDTWFLWEGTHWQHNHQGPKGHLHQRVFSDPITFINWGEEFGNGAGVLFYPGRMPHYPEEDRGLDRLLGSIKLKNIRRGQQDYELMWLAERKAGRDKVLAIIRKAVPRGLNEVRMEEPVPWSERGDDYDRARAALLDILAGK